MVHISDIVQLDSKCEGRTNKYTGALVSLYTDVQIQMHEGRHQYLPGTLTLGIHVRLDCPKPIFSVELRNSSLGKIEKNLQLMGQYLELTAASVYHDIHIDDMHIPEMHEHLPFKSRSKTLGRMNLAKSNPLEIIIKYERPTQDCQ